MENASFPSQFIFRCKTNDAYIIKILLELLHNNIKTACFEITPKGIFLCMTDSNHRTLIDLKLHAKDFNLFYLKPASLSIGVNVNHQYKMLKSVKKKDSLQLFIHENAPTDLGIQILPKDHSRLTTSYIRIQNIQNLEIQLPDPYPHTILISSSEFSKMCKDMLNISNSILILANQYSAKFVCNLGSVYSREVILGETEVEKYANHDGFYPNVSGTSSSITEKENGGYDFVFKDDFETEQLSRIVKISGLSNNININCHENMPLLIQSKVGSLGEINIYIKSRRQIEEEQQQRPSSPLLLSS